MLLDEPERSDRRVNNSIPSNLVEYTGLRAQNPPSAATSHGQGRSQLDRLVIGNNNGTVESEQRPQSGSSPVSHPQLKVAPTAAASRTMSNNGEATSPPPAIGFAGVSLDLPSTGLSDEIGTNSMKFSQRGSMLIDGNRVNGSSRLVSARTMPVIQEPDVHTIGLSGRVRSATVGAERPQVKEMTVDEQQSSEKVRLCYVLGSDTVTHADTWSLRDLPRNLRVQDLMTRDNGSQVTVSNATSTTELSDVPPSPQFFRGDHELAGGLEDWADVDNEDVDRYGFIIPKASTALEKSRGGTKRVPTGTGPGLQRVSTSLQLASETPRQKHGLRRTPSTAQSTKSGSGYERPPSVVSFGRPASTRSLRIPRSESTTRHLANKLPRNRDRRVMDEAADMLTLPRVRSNTSATLARTTTESDAGGPSATNPVFRHKETEREEKWRRMAKTTPSRPGAVGGGMTFTFDLRSAKLVERTWKGIPDTWRATAWHSFLSASVEQHDRRHPHQRCLSDEALSELFHDYQNQNSPDDVQIDIDVPRTISSHIMFRRRYRGGQRLLFRVLHAHSLHFAEQGYVQGIAALAATLLSYYEETMAFVMLVRMWELRGLAKLYAPGFGGLMEALDDFEKDWLGQGELRKRLDALMVGPTAYGTKWYLTLFNYSVPFGCQLRVWDVLMLLGDNEMDDTFTAPVTDGVSQDVPPTEVHGVTSERFNFGTTLDVLHATSAALIDGMRDILLESDFENAMKVLTSWVPIRDEDLFMRVAKAEYKLKESSRKKGKRK